MVLLTSKENPYKQVFSILFTLFMLIISLNKVTLFRLLTFLISRIGILWRLLGVMVNATFFWSGGLFLCTIVFPIITLTTKSQERKHKRARFCIQHTFQLFLWSLSLWGVLKIQKKELRRLQNQKGTLLICNHPSLLDTVLIMGHFKNIQCIVKGELWTHPILGGIVRTAGYIPNNMEPEAFLELCRDQLSRGENILIFPEGTRTKINKPLHLKRGLSNLALATQANIQTLTLSCSPPALTKEDKWYKLPSRRVLFQLSSGPLFVTKDYKADAPRSLRARALTQEVQSYYNRYLGYE
ncbi:MAG TPA: hypothetical protein DD412_05125 [Holosporales bacterium]|nr:hypothetical protein [Holosporales bacterium]